MINIAEILKDCPKGMELDCTMHEDVVTFYGISNSYIYPILVSTKRGDTISLTKYGQFFNSDGFKCVIFPKGKTTWEDFQRPFKDGDVVTSKSDSNIVAFIYKERINTTLVKSHFILYVDNMGIYKNGCIALKENEIVFATKEEKEKLFDVIKEHGYQWNDKTKTLEKLFIPKFKVGDIVQYEDGYKVRIIEVNTDDNLYVYESLLAKGIGSIPFDKENDWELSSNKFIDIFTPFKTKVLVRNKYGYLWKPAIIFGYYIKNEITPYCVLGGTCWRQCIPYEGNEHLLNTKYDCDDFYKNWE